MLQIRRSRRGKYSGGGASANSTDPNFFFGATGDSSRRVDLTTGTCDSNLCPEQHLRLNRHRPG